MTVAGLILLPSGEKVDRAARRMRGLSAMHQDAAGTRRARRLRASMTGAEAALWSLLRGRAFEGLKFRRQAPIAGCVVDFACSELKLVLELDGGVPDLREAEDQRRDQRLADAGYTVLRFRNAVFTADPNRVLDAIRSHRAALRTHSPHPGGSAAHLLPQGEKGERS